jgi:hypothetical protein
MRSEKFGFRLSPHEKAMLRRIARRAERTPADVLRRLIRQAARDQGAGSRDARDASTEELRDE